MAQQEVVHGREKRLKGVAPEGCSPFMAQFDTFSTTLDAINERRERIVKSSRDTTMASKKVIFLLHRLTPATKMDILEQATRDLLYIVGGPMSRISAEVEEKEELWRFQRSFSPGMQEYVEAATFAHYCRYGEVASLDVLNQQHGEGLQNLRVLEADYVLGLGDLTGELMRMAINGVASGDGELAASLKQVVRDIHGAFLTMPKSPQTGKEMGKKMETMLQSLIKIETASYTVRVRGSEYPEADMTALLESSQQREEGTSEEVYA